MYDRLVLCISVKHNAEHLSAHRFQYTVNPDGLVKKMEYSEESPGHGVLGGRFVFKKLPHGGVDKSVVLCIICQKEFAYHRSSSTLRYHLNAKHPAANTDAAAAAAAAPTAVALSSGKRDGVKPTAENLTNSLAAWIALDCRPLSVVEDKGLENVLQVATCDPTLKLPCTKTISDLIQQLYDTEKNSKLDALKRAQFVALTGDHWTSFPDINYIGVTAHIAGVADWMWHLQSFVLTVLQTDAKHAGNCAEQLLSVAEAWGLEQQITTVATDGVCSATRQPRFPFQHMPCIAHILQRSVTASVAEAGFHGALAKCREIVRHFKHSFANTEELYQEQSRLGREEEPLIADVFPKWNSTLDMISCLLKNQEAIFAALDKKKLEVAVLTPSELLELQKLAAVLEPCRFVTELLGGETFVPCSVVLPALCHLRHTMEVSDEDSEHIVKFKTTFTQDLSRHAGALNHRWLRMATVLDPRFKDLKCLARAEREDVWSGLEALLQEQYEGSAAQEPAKKKRLLLSPFDSDSDSEEEAPCSRALNLYRAEATIGETDCPLRWWSTRAGTHSQLSVLARKYLSSPATSVPCHRLFSLAGHRVTKKRAALGSENVNTLVCLSSWLKDRHNK